MLRRLLRANLTGKRIHVNGAAVSLKSAGRRRAEMNASEAGSPAFGGWVDDRLQFGTQLLIMPHKGGVANECSPPDPTAPVVRQLQPWPAVAK
jgi:hypothetical protein